MRGPGADDGLVLVFLVGEVLVEFEEFFEGVVVGAEAVGGEDEFIELLVKFGEWLTDAATGFFCHSVIKLCDTPVFGLHGFTAVFV